MKKILKAFLVFILIFALICGGIAVWQWDNVKVIFMTMNKTQDEIDSFAVENEKKTDELLKKFTDTEFHSLTDEEIEKISRGELTEEEVIELIKGNKDTGKIDEIISKIYALRAEFVGALSSLEAEAQAMRKSIPKKEKTISKRLQLIDYYTGRAEELEQSCDARMESLIAELETELKRSGGDMSLISDVRSAYQAEKAAKKSQLLGKYSKYFK